ncbi:Alkaline phosphatase [Enhygromyxa salina]|uniref:Alkaline phosphatase n=1 Tax=Enhygromyxa salina TaxID=215803 RepID=A0A0C2A1T8_9BACT|nr:hypothetical protein [Enhygromyxa salina]KIG17338.1 Alkaline phosphatase [Enhygromyxa salina]
MLSCSAPPSSEGSAGTSGADTGSTGDGDGDPGEPGDGDPGDGDPGDGDPGDPGDGDGDDPPPEVVTIAHQFDPIGLDPFEERLPCISWTIDNEQALYVQAVTLANTGGFHHSNGFVVPDTLYDGPDGVWDCKSRGFDTLEASVKGTVLFAQSTQSWVEDQRFNPGAVVKIPPKHRVVAELHLLNLSPSNLDASLRLSLDLLHPKDVDVVLTPFAYQYTDLQIQPLAESRFVAECDEFMQLASPGAAPYALHWLLPHYHYLGNYFSVEVIGGAQDGAVLHQVEGFNASPAGKRFDPPLDISDADGIRLTCGYDNWTDSLIGWGVGDQEMCIAFGFADTPNISQATASSGSAVGLVDGIPHFQGDCFSLIVPKPEGHGPPSPAELEAELYLPPIDPADQGLPPFPPCEDTPDNAVASLSPTLSNVAANVFVPACGFSSCHGSGGSAGGLNLEGDLHATLLGHPVVANTSLPLIDPGNPEGSWLYRKLSRCEPLDANMAVVSHMPLNAPFLLSPGLVATVRDWIAGGAADN